MVILLTDQSERLLPDCTSDQSQDGFLTVLLGTKVQTLRLQPAAADRDWSVAG